jgi:guanylate kinase
MPEVSISEHARKTRHPGRLFLVTAPSGAGKSSLVNALLARQPNIKLSISNTTRDPRPGEVNGREYHFVTEDMFLEMKSRGEFLESAYVHGHYYGTSRPWIESQMARGNDVLLEIDWQGARQVRSQFEGTVGIFILPPSIDALEARLHKRGTDSEATITRRLMGAGAEIAHAPEFEFVIINDSFDVALSQLISVVTASRLNFQNQAARHREQFISLGVPV